jgi:prepilin-type N-terminal cleavage/methylation domain-containing protein
VLAGLIRKIHRGEAGFTLIELMIVILVILILAAILVPQFSLARERARKASCVSNQRNLETAVAMWSTDNPNVAYIQGKFSASTPGWAALTGGGNPQYTLPGAFFEPDDPAGGSGGPNSTGQDYFLSAGGATGGSAPSYGHAACQYANNINASGCTPGDPWVNCYSGAGTAPATAGLNHERGAGASP